MNLLATLSSSYRQFLITGEARIDKDSQDRNRPVSPYTEMMSTLQALRQSDPLLYHRVQQEFVASLQAASQAVDEAVDIRTLINRRRTARLRSVVSRLNRIAYVLFPGSGETITPRW